MMSCRFRVRRQRCRDYVLSRIGFFVATGDVVCDLGSGDGRIVIAAARDRGATGIGVEIDPQYIRMARLNAAADGVDDKVTFAQDDLFDMDFSDATVVALYLSEPLNLRLRPILLEELKPGARIVSHKFGMGDREPEQTLNIGGHIVHYSLTDIQVGRGWSCPSS